MAFCAFAAAWTISRLSSSSLEPGDPALNVSHGVAVGVLVANAGNGAKIGGSHLRNQLLFAVEFITEVSAKGAIQAACVACAVD